jgi:hypothetical protein
VLPIGLSLKGGPHAIIIDIKHMFIIFKVWRESRSTHHKQFKSQISPQINISRRLQRLSLPLLARMGKHTYAISLQNYEHLHLGHPPPQVLG